MVSLDLINVTLVSERAGREMQIGGLGLSFGDRGLTVRRPSGSEFATIPWTRIERLEADAEDRQFGGLSTGVALEVRSDNGHHRFLVPHVTPEALTTSLAAMSGHYGRSDVVGAPPKGKRKGR